MPVEIMGEAGTPGADREWIEAECQLAIKHLKKVCGQLPPEMELEVQWQRPIGECDTWRFVRVHREVRGDSDWTKTADRMSAGSPLLDQR